MSEPERSMGVLLVTDALEPGGLERVVVELAAGLAEAGHAVGVHAAAGGGFWDRLPETVMRHPLDGTPTAGSIRALLRSGRYAVVHAHQRRVSMLARIAATGLGVPVVEHVHNVFRPSPIARLLSFRAPMLIACGTAVRTMLIDGFGRPAGRVRTVLNGVHDDPAGAVAPLPSASGDGTIRLVGIGRLSEQKDPLRFVRVIGALRDVLPGPLSAVWVGSGPLLGQVIAEIDRLQLHDVVAFVGHQDDVHPFLQDADALLLTSRWEGLPLVALEALAAGRGVILPGVGSCADALGDVEVGLLFEPTLTDDQLAQALAGALTPSSLARWSDAARRRFEEHFTFDRMLEQVRGVYAEALSSSPRPARAPAARSAS